MRAEAVEDSGAGAEPVVGIDGTGDGICFLRHGNGW